MNREQKTLIVITGPTGVGKTSAAIDMAERLGCEIINADSRQIYRDIPIGTSAPTAEEQERVRHHFVGIKNLEEYYSAAEFESDVLRLLEGNLWHRGDYAVMCGGSMLYVDAVCKGIDELPTISDAVRSAVAKKWHEEGAEALLEELRRLDADYYEQVDRQNMKRVAHAVEICREAGRPYSTLRTGRAKTRDFRIVKMGLNLPREELFCRINHRVDTMLEAGLEAEARAVYHLRHLNSLNTVGFKEMFAYFEGKMDYVTACERIKKNTRVYAKKQLTWYAKDAEIEWCAPDELGDAMMRRLG
ncbi:MAG: tRNA (adenosine(37)-N6)-dimethylallyltransferase MiaA [Muribaculaceae bacterium]|nr:tRNA (adenosine(37)-N6)-dimethylallyltransferase MiaA [Muribaculaceae bacterium]